MKHSAWFLCLTCFLTFCLSSWAKDKTAGDEKAEKTSVTIASCSFVPTKWDKESNLKKIEQMARDAASKQADLVVMPEGALEGFVKGQVATARDPEMDKRFLALAEPLDGEYMLKLRSLAKEMKIWLCVGFAERSGNVIYNSAALIDRKGEIVGIYHKNHESDSFSAPAFYRPGDSIPVFDTEFGKVGIMICFDRQIPEVAACLALQGAKLILNPSYGGTGEWNDCLIRTRARDTGTVVVFSHPIQSLIANEKGDLLARSDGEDKTLLKDVVLPAKTRKILTKRRPELYKIITADKEPAGRATP